MSNDLIDIHTDNSQAVIDKVTKRLSEKGVLLHDQDETQTDITIRYVGMSNKRKASYTAASSNALSRMLERARAIARQFHSAGELSI